MKKFIEIDAKCLYINGLAIDSKETWDLIADDYYKVKKENIKLKAQIFRLVRKYKARLLYPKLNDTPQKIVGDMLLELSNMYGKVKEVIINEK